MSKDRRALTIRANGGVLLSIRSEVFVGAPYVEGGMMPLKTKVVGLWDTGASGTVITKETADKIGVKPVSRTLVHHADGSTERNVYLVDVTLPNDVAFPLLRVTEGDLAGFDVLIGMDIITAGDFSITNHGDNTVASFRVPSCHEIDYVREIELQNKNTTIAKYLPAPGSKRKKRG